MTLDQKNEIVVLLKNIEKKLFEPDLMSTPIGCGYHSWEYFYSPNYRRCIGCGRIEYASSCGGGYVNYHTFCDSYHCHHICSECINSCYPCR